jgi:hypothetical protein
MAARNREPLAGTARIVAWIVAILYIISSIYIIQHLDEFKRVFDMGL